jgi:hypothetical protein
MNVRVSTVVIAAITLVAPGSLTFAQQDRYALKVPNGLAFSDFKGYDTWQEVAVSETEGSVKAILANPAMIKAYKEGIPDNGKLFPEGVKIVKIEWVKKKNPVSLYFVEIPDILKTVSFMEKDSKRFPNTTRRRDAERRKRLAAINTMRPPLARRTTPRKIESAFLN